MVFWWLGRKGFAFSDRKLGAPVCMNLLRQLCARCHRNIHTYQTGGTPDGSLNAARPARVGSEMVMISTRTIETHAVRFL